LHSDTFDHPLNFKGSNVKHHLVRPSLLLACAFASIASASNSPQKDPAGAHDHPIISRFTGSVITGYKTIDFDEVTLPLTPLQNYAFAKTDSSRGRITRIAYVAPPGKSLLEISTNFEQALASAGFQKRFTCRGTQENPACGDAYQVSQAVLPGRILSGMASDAIAQNKMVDILRPTSGDIFVETARLDRPEGPVDLVLMVSSEEGRPAGIYLQICEVKAMEAGQVTVNAKGMSQGLAQQGHIALYGVHFETDSAAITSDSKPTLAQMASLMKSQPELKVFIVGHTDNTGTVDHNLTLSTQRAQAVVKALQDLGVPATRMSAKGMASFSPVAANTTDEGSARNRRVELVAQ
jgi:OmpA-OmpF porin, OOP family